MRGSVMLDTRLGNKADEQFRHSQIALSGEYIIATESCLVGRQPRSRIIQTGITGCKTRLRIPLKGTIREHFRTCPLICSARGTMMVALVLAMRIIAECHLVHLPKIGSL